MQKVGLMNHHKKTVHADKTKLDFLCDLCNFATYCQRYLTTHLHVAHPNSKEEREFTNVCELCKRRFQFPHELEEHDVIISLKMSRIFYEN